MENPHELISLDNFEVNLSSRSQFQTNSNQPTSLLNIQQFNNSNLNQSNSLSQNYNQTNRPLAGNNKYFISRREERVHQNYPTVYVIFHSVFFLACGLGLISGEIIASSQINNWDIFSNQIAGGIFSGSLIIFAFFLTLITTQTN
ncbi:hypothetical protein BpHYR1_034078 [Brachionus plicatilis]|uniref:Uncharacterized protein n=1 Tax=Brachionus plicatilis TaxID=10195 RepID=A0A3M7R866_BRAPC|nr:hypothetical protein BpHYR1_034078 [Brachionus plicatilis]